MIPSRSPQQPDDLGPAAGLHTRGSASSSEAADRPQAGTVKGDAPTTGVDV